MEFKADRPAPTVDDAIKAIKVLYEYHLTMDNDDGLTYEHEGKQLAFKVEVFFALNWDPN